MRKVFCYLSAFLVAVCFYSCSYENEEFYSCDADADTWAKANLNEIRQMTRSEWESMENPLYQQAAYVAFSPEQKTEFWQIKLNLAMDLDWSVEEKMHIADLLEFINEDPELFIRKEPTDNFYIYVHNWIEYAQEELKWNQSIIWSILMSTHTVADKRGNVLQPSMTSVSVKSSSEQKCDCHEGNILWTTCSSIVNKSCNSTPCNDSVHGCGAMTVESCNGVCEVDGIF